MGTPAPPVLPPPFPSRQPALQLGGIRRFRRHVGRGRYWLDMASTVFVSTHPTYLVADQNCATIHSGFQVWPADGPSETGSPLQFVTPYNQGPAESVRIVERIGLADSYPDAPGLATVSCARTDRRLRLPTWTLPTRLQHGYNSSLMSGGALDRAPAAGPFIEASAGPIQGRVLVDRREPQTFPPRLPLARA